MKKFSLLFAIVVCLTSCGGGAADEIADALCGCSKILDEGSANAGNATSAEDLFQASGETSKKFSECVLGVQEKYKGKASGDEIKEALKKKCPDFEKKLPH